MILEPLEGVMLMSPVRADCSMVTISALDQLVESLAHYKKKRHLPRLTALVYGCKYKHQDGSFPVSLVNPQLWLLH